MRSNLLPSITKAPFSVIDGTTTVFYAATNQLSLSLSDLAANSPAVGFNITHSDVPSVVQYLFSQGGIAMAKDTEPNAQTLLGFGLANAGVTVKNSATVYSTLLPGTTGLQVVQGANTIGLNAGVITLNSLTISGVANNDFTFTPLGAGRGINIASTSGVLKINSVQMLQPRITGWTAATNTFSRATFDTTTVTTAQLAQRVGQLITDLMTHGLIGT